MKKNNIKGFTLVELLGILVVLSIIGLITFVAITSIIKKGREDALDKQLNYIILAAKNYMSDHSDELPSELNSSTVKLGTLKIGGYVDMEVRNPNTKKCFKNDLTITVTKNSDSVNYDYTISRENGNIDTDDSCSVGHVENPDVNPTISFSTFSYIGEKTTQEATIYYNKSVSDTTAREKIKSYIEYTTGSEMRTNNSSTTLTIYGEQSETNGYSRKIKIDINYSLSPERQDKLYLYADNGFITTDSGDKTSRVTSNPIKIIGNPSINLYDEDETLFTSASEMAVNKLRVNETEENNNLGVYYEEKATRYFCTGNGHYQTIKFNTTSNETITYKVLDSNDQVIHEKTVNNGTQDVYFSVIENTYQESKSIQYKLKACNATGCSEVELKYNHRDCLPPTGSYDIDSTLTIKDLFDDAVPVTGSETDVKSGLDYAYAFIHPSSNIMNYSQNMFKGLYQGYRTYDLDDSVATFSGGIPIGKYELDTPISTIISAATNKDTFCLETKYVYLVLIDKATIVNTFKIGTINGLPDDCNGNKGTFIEDGECHNDSYICDMIRNSQSWFSRKLTDEDKSKLHNENAEICFKNNSNCYYGNGKWYDCSNGYCTDLYTHTQTTVSSDDLEYVTSQL